VIRSVNGHNNPTDIYLSEKEGQKKYPAKEEIQREEKGKNPTVLCGMK